LLSSFFSFLTLLNVVKLNSLTVLLNVVKQLFFSFAKKKTKVAKKKRKELF
jgi:hypothetical protein